MRQQWGRYMTAGGLKDLSRSYTIPASAAVPAVTTGGIAIGVSLAKKLKAKTGDAVRMVAPVISPDGSLSTKSGQSVIGAIFDSGMNFVDTNMAFMNLNQRAGFLRPRRQSDKPVRLVNLNQTDAVTAAIRKRFPIRIGSTTG